MMEIVPEEARRLRLDAFGEFRHPMKRTGIAFFALAFASLGLFYAWVKLKADSNDAKPDEPVIIRGTTQKHFVTPAMLESTGKMAEQAAPAFQTEATDGKRYALETLAKEGPFLLLFIKDGCPCSQAAQPFFNQLHETYGSKIPFFGVFDGEVPRAQAWGKENHVPFSILADSKLKLMKDYKAESSAYVALVSKGGTIEKLWPGYSIEMLKELNLRLARAASLQPAPLDLADAPDEMLSGCPYDF